ncbi:hypothetical protein FC99_GL000466 [Levilactobacillus koreensis JCM 16448]|uniref:DUF1700 domain-containing protein n=1 Tax=Levilactobacillus koreensis TaxID=637971 RepID=A0AAC8UV11_9LACO|nr:DUF1700 domain-containing protein [Levilactobacillus koreensis]AKP64239.1 hypothetical protein ABN16_04005 [Levilactobacillus koreensis]KRK92313.1 hypothetical protein FC99_GL000466 [Levilactobacillus koreensis JCM 16448]
MNDYIQAVQKLLGQLTTAEQQDVIEYYQEYLMDAGIETYEQAVDELGTPRSLARKVLADYSIRSSSQESQSIKSRSDIQATKNNVKTVWLIILALLSTPVTIPILILIGALFVAFAAVIFGLVVAAFAVFLSIIAVGVLGVVLGVTTFFQAPWTGVFYLGMGLAALGASWIGWLIVKWFGSKVIWALSWAAKKIYNRFIPRSRAERGRKL